MILSFFTQKSTRSAKLSSVFAERFSGVGQADFPINKAHKVSLKGRNNLYISCVFNGFKYMSLYYKVSIASIKVIFCHIAFLNILLFITVKLEKI